MMEQLRLGIVGVGSIVEKKHFLALAEVPEITVVAVCRRDAEKLAQVAHRFRVSRRYTDYRELLDDREVEAVLIATGPKAQPEIAMAAVAAGKHVFAEKPMAETATEARRMGEAICGSTAHFQIGFNKRFYYGYRKAKRLVQDGELGKPSGISARFWFQPGRADPLLHNGIHFFDLVRFFMGPAEEVLARSCRAEASPAPGGETVAVSLRFATGAVGNLLLSSLASWDYVSEHVDVVGSNHNVLSVENGRLLRVFRRGQDKTSQLHENTLSAHWWSGNEEQGFVLQLRAFAQGLLRGTQTAPDGDDLSPMVAGAEEGIRSLELLEAVRRSLATGTSVPVPSRPDQWVQQTLQAGTAG